MKTETEVVEKAWWMNEITLSGLYPAETGLEGLVKAKGGWVVVPDFLNPLPKRLDAVSTTAQDFADRVGKKLGLEGWRIVNAIAGTLDDLRDERPAPAPEAKA